VKIEKSREIKLHRNLIKEYKVRYGPNFCRLYHHHWNNKIISYLPRNRNLSVLDCGCGSGILLEDLVNRYGTVTGVDISSEMIGSTDPSIKEKTTNLVIGDGEELPFRKESFDIILCRGSLHHLPSPAKALRDIYISLKPGGCLVLSEPCSDSLLLHIPRKVIIDKSAKFSDTHKAFPSKELTKLLSGLGFTIRGKERFGFLAFPLCGLVDFLPVMKYLPFNVYITKVLIMLDELFSHIPFIKRQSWHIIIQAVKV